MYTEKHHSVSHQQSRIQTHRAVASACSRDNSLPSFSASFMCSSTTQFQMNLVNSILVVRFAQWLGETENLIGGYFCCTLLSSRLEDHFPPQIWCTPTTSPSILCAISPVFSSFTANKLLSGAQKEGRSEREHFTTRRSHRNGATYEAECATAPAR